jgi:hypothetical protein
MESKNKALRAVHLLPTELSVPISVSRRIAYKILVIGRIRYYGRVDYYVGIQRGEALR